MDLGTIHFVYGEGFLSKPQLNHISTSIGFDTKIMEAFIRKIMSGFVHKEWNTVILGMKSIYHWKKHNYFWLLHSSLHNNQTIIGQSEKNQKWVFQSFESLTPGLVWNKIGANKQKNINIKSFLLWHFKLELCFFSLCHTSYWYHREVIRKLFHPLIDLFPGW